MCIDKEDYTHCGIGARVAFVSTTPDDLHNAGAALSRPRNVRGSRQNLGAFNVYAERKTQ